jgi:uncharacterized coiled-coil DUF342 family protein
MKYLKDSIPMMAKKDQIYEEIKALRAKKKEIAEELSPLKETGREFMSEIEKLKKERDGGREGEKFTKKRVEEVN